MKKKERERSGRGAGAQREIETKRAPPFSLILLAARESGEDGPFSREEYVETPPPTWGGGGRSGQRLNREDFFLAKRPPSPYPDFLVQWRERWMEGEREGDTENERERERDKDREREGVSTS